MPQLICVPVYLYPTQRLGFTRCKVVPGVSISRLNGPLKKVVDYQIKTLPPAVQPAYGITHVIRIEEDEYFKALKSRVLSERGLQIPDESHVDAESIAKQVVLSLVLEGRLQFYFRGIYTLDWSMKGKKAVYQPHGWANSSLCEVSPPLAFALTGGMTKKIEGVHIAQMAEKLDRYFCSGIWWSDRMGMALKYLWNGLCAHYPEQAFIDLATALEALLSTQGEGITHILAERIGLLLSKNSADGISIYNCVKQLYSIRSKIVHGKLFPKKGILNAESLFITAKRSNIPISQLKSIMNLTILSIKAVFKEQELLKIIQTKRDEDKISKDVDGFFVQRLFRK